MHAIYLHPKPIRNHLNSNESIDHLSEKIQGLIRRNFAPQLGRNALLNKQLSLRDLGIENEFCTLLGFIIENQFNIVFPTNLNADTKLLEIESSIQVLFQR